MKTVTRVAALATLLLLIAFSTRAALQRREGDAALAALAPLSSQLREEIARLESRLQSAQDALLKLEQNTTVQEVSDAPAKAARPLQPLTLIANDPQKLAEYLRHFRGTVAMNYGGMFKAVGLSPEQIEKFTDVEVRLEESRIDLAAAIDSQGLSRDSAEARKLRSDNDKRRAPMKREVLGELADKYFEYYNTMGPRLVAQRLAWTSAFTGEPVTAVQVERAADVLVANSRRPGPGLEVASGTVDWSTARTQLGGILSPSQIETLGQLVARDTAQWNYFREGGRLSREFNSRAAAK